MPDSSFDHLKQQLLGRLVTGEIDEAEYERLLSRLERDTSKPSRSDTPLNASVGDQPTRAAGRCVLSSGFPLDEFVLDERVGRGGMGDVWKARDTIGARDVVIKVLPPELSDNPGEIARVKDSFQKVHALNHEHICPTYVLRRHSQVGYYLVMQHLDATTLGTYRRNFVATTGEFPLSEIVRLLSQVAKALDYAHSRKVIHRDIKPENIMVSRDGKEVWVIDFGLAAEIQSSLTRVSKVQMDRSGTYPYMAPEQWRGQYQDARTDQYALAIVAYELLAGRLPFDGDPFILQGCALNEPLPTIANASQAVNQALSKATAKIREERFASCGGFVAAFAATKATLGRSFVNFLDMKLVRIPAGEFLMGSRESAAEIARIFDAKAEDFESEHPQHRVQLSRDFYLGANQVTLGAFRQFVNATGYKTDAEKDREGGWGWNEATGKLEGRDPQYNWTNPGFTQTDAHPVVNVSWNDAAAFCNWLSQHEGRRYRLPTEAEWEYACRAGTTTMYPHGDDPEGLALIGNVADASLKQKLANYITWTYISANDLHAFTSPVGSFEANAFGLYDMLGNCWEWCADWYSEDFYAQSEDYYAKTPEVDPSGPGSGSSRILRGGSWGNGPERCRSATRNRRTSARRYYDVGFRVVCESE